MKNFTKISLLLAGIFFATGCVLGGIGSIGDRTFSEAVSGDGELQWAEELIENFYHSHGSMPKTKKYQTQSYEGDAQPILEEAEEIAVPETLEEAVPGASFENHSGNHTDASDENHHGSYASVPDNTIWDSVTESGQYAGNGGALGYKVDASMVTKLDLELGGGSFSIQEKSANENQDTIEIIIEGKGKCSYAVKKNTLHIEGFTGLKTVSDTAGSNNSVTIFVPESHYFEEIEAEIGAGYLDIYDIYATKLELDIGAGEAGLYDMQANKLSLTIGAGNFESLGLWTNDADIEVGMGSCYYSGSITGKLEADCGMGNMEFWLEGKETDHNYEIECAAGNVSIGNSFSATALATEKFINNHASSTFEIECSMGNVSISFDNWN